MYVCAITHAARTCAKIYYDRTPCACLQNKSNSHTQTHAVKTVHAVRQDLPLFQQIFTNSQVFMYICQHKRRLNVSCCAYMLYAQLCVCVNIAQIILIIQNFTMCVAFEFFFSLANCNWAQSSAAQHCGRRLNFKTVCANNWRLPQLNANRAHVSNAPSLSSSSYTQRTIFS